MPARGSWLRDERSMRAGIRLSATNAIVENGWVGGAWARDPPNAKVVSIHGQGCGGARNALYCPFSIACPLCNAKHFSVIIPYLTPATGAQHTTARAHPQEPRAEARGADRVRGSSCATKPKAAQGTGA